MLLGGVYCLIPFLSKTKKCLQDSHLVTFRIKAKISVFEGFFYKYLTKHHRAFSKLVNILISEIWPSTFPLSQHFIFPHEFLFPLLFMVSLWDFPSSKFYSKIFSLALNDDLLEFSFQMRNILLLLEKRNPLLPLTMIIWLEA